MYGDTPKDKRRAAVAASLRPHVCTVPPSRLLALVGQALKWQQSQGLLAPGARFDLFRGAAVGARDEVEAHPAVLERAIKFGAKSHPEAAAFCPDGTCVATGSVDGFIEVWDHVAGRLRADLSYQADERFMMHDAAVLALAWSADGALLASGDKAGAVKVWKLATGVCLRRYDAAHGAGITSLAFSADGSHLLSAAYDGLARVHGLKSGRMLKEFRGHTSYVYSAAYTSDGSQVLTGSGDGSVRVWDARTGDCAATFKPPPAAGGREPAVLAVLPLPGSPDQAVVVSRAPAAHVVTTAGQVVRSLVSGKREGGDFCAAALSPRGEWCLCLGEDGVLYCFGVGGGRLEHVLPVCEGGAGPIGVAQHPHRNLTATWATDGELRLWAAA